MVDFPDYKGYKIQVTSEGKFEAWKEGQCFGGTATLAELRKLVDKLNVFKGPVYVHTEEGYKPGKILQTVKCPNCGFDIVNPFLGVKKRRQ